MGVRCKLVVRCNCISLSCCEHPLCQAKLITVSTTHRSNIFYVRSLGLGTKFHRGKNHYFWRYPKHSSNLLISFLNTFQLNTLCSKWQIKITVTCTKCYFPHLHYAVYRCAGQAWCAVNCVITEVTWCDLWTNHHRSAVSILHSTFCSSAFYPQPCVYIRIRLAVGDWLLCPSTVFFTVGFVLVLWAAIVFFCNLPSSLRIPSHFVWGRIFSSLSSPLGLYTPFTSCPSCSFLFGQGGTASNPQHMNVTSLLYHAFFGNTACLFR